MRRTALVISDIPALRRGLATSLRASRVTVVEHERWPAELAHTDDTAIVWTCDDVAELASIHQRTRTDRDVPLVVLLRQQSVVATAQAVDAGAAAVAGWDVDAPALLALVEAACTGLAAVPRHVARRMAAGAQAQTPVELTDDERQVLADLCQGVSVSRMALRLGYSERETFRRLAHLYRKIGVANRTGAVMAAARWGLG
jgi:DNA-binding NarL/FixJ family response regulator